MRKPNGYGSIKHLSGRRRRPFVFVVSQEGRQKPVEYFASQIEAEIFAADYNKIHRIIDDMRKISDNKSGDIVNPNNNGFTHGHGGIEARQSILKLTGKATCHCCFVDSVLIHCLGYSND